MVENKNTSRLENKIKCNKFVVTSEISPPKGTNFIEIFKNLKGVEGIDAVNVTDQQSSIMRMNTLSMSYYVKKQGFEPIFQITCRDRNRIALQSDLLGVYSLGIKNVLVLTGDHPNFGDHPEAKPVFDLDSVQLLKVISDLRNGTDMVGNKLNGKPDFYVGGVVNPGVNPIEPEIIKMEKKVNVGAEFFQTQAVYELSILKSFMSKIKHLKVPVIIGIIPLKSVSMANYINDNLAGVSVPDSYIRRLEDADNIREESINITVEYIKEIRELVQGVHIMPINWPTAVKKILEKLDI